MRRSPFLFASVASVSIMGAAHASDTPVYATAPAWVKPAPAIETAKLTDASPVILRFDNQQRLEADGTVWAYQDLATRAATSACNGSPRTATSSSMRSRSCVGSSGSTCSRERSRSSSCAASRGSTSGCSTAC
jgi:hypothetical protein